MPKVLGNKTIVQKKYQRESGVIFNYDRKWEGAICWEILATEAKG